MQQTVPTQFLTGVIRLIAVFYGLRAIDAVQSAIMGYQMQMTAAPEVAATFPSVWSIYLPSLTIYVALVVITWLAAPRICGQCIPITSANEQSELREISWNEVMIFLFGTLFFAWGINRVGDEIIQLIPRPGKNAPFELSIRSQIHFYIGIALAGGGAVMCSRFSSIYQWMKRRSKTP
jgi:hypothetical protein